MQEVLHVFYAVMTGGFEIVAFLAAGACILTAIKVVFWLYGTISRKLEAK